VRKAFRDAIGSLIGQPITYTPNGWPMARTAATVFESGGSKPPKLIDAAIVFDSILAKFIIDINQNLSWMREEANAIFEVKISEMIVEPPLGYFPPRANVEFRM
jgi:hypothetical protein